jgi:hypothetical protein
MLAACLSVCSGDAAKALLRVQCPHAGPSFRPARADRQPASAAWVHLHFARQGFGRALVGPALTGPPSRYWSPRGWYRNPRPYTGWRSSWRIGSATRVSGWKILRRMEIVMRVFTFAALLLGTLAAWAPASAQTYGAGYPVCMHAFGEQIGERMDCVYTSLAQCAAAASGLPATCLINPYYAPARRLHGRER